MFEIVEEMFQIDIRKVNLYEFSKNNKYYQVRTYQHHNLYDAELYEVRYKIVDHNPKRHFNYQFIDKVVSMANEEYAVRELLSRSFQTSI